MAQTNILLETGTNELEIVEFYVNQDGYEAHYGLNVAKVVEIGRRADRHGQAGNAPQSPAGGLSPSQRPHCAAHRHGQFLGSGPITNEDAKVIVTEFNTVCTGFLVSGVNRIYRLSWTDVEAPGNFLQNVSRSSVTGVVRLEERVIFLLDLEAIVAELHPAMAISFDGAAMNDADGKTYNILHVDDSSSIRSLVLDLLNKEGRFNVVQHVNGQEAWDYLQRLRARSEEEGKPISSYVQGIISDIEMPSMDGLALCKRIKTDPMLNQVPVAIFSSMINESLARKCASVGADAQYTKPDLKALSVKLHDLITRAWA